MKVVLISLLPTTENFGIKHINSYLLSKGHESAIVFIPRHRTQAGDALNKFLAEFNPDIVGCGFMSYEASFAKFLGEKIKARFPELPLIVGGIHPTINPEECLDYADYVCVGEGEEVMLEIAERVDIGQSFSDVQNLVHKQNGTFTRNTLRPLIEDLDCLPFPGHKPEKSYVFHKDAVLPMDMSLFRQYTRYDGKAYNIISSRGCPFSCSYCCNSFLSKLYDSKKLRRRSPQNFIQEMRNVFEQFPDMILMNIHDDCFLAQPAEWHREFMQEYKKWIGLPFIVRSTPLHLNEEKIEILKEAGLAWVTMGLQSGSENTNKNVFLRKVSNEKFLEATRLCHKHKISGYYDVILDNPFENDDDVIETINVLKQVPKPFQLQLFSLTFYKGTDIYDMYKEKFGMDSDPDIQNYFGYRRTFLNKMVRVTPLLPSSWVSYFIERRTNLFVRGIFNLFYAVIALVLEPLSFFYLMLSAFRNNLVLTLKITLPTFKTKIRERLMSFGSDFS
jgi:radical SAM superfamily enzyme YgiQ (UPF0313 family)